MLLSSPRGTKVFPCLSRLDEPLRMREEKVTGGVEGGVKGGVEVGAKNGSSKYREAERPEKTKER